VILKVKTLGKPGAVKHLSFQNTIGLLIAQIKSIPAFTSGLRASPAAISPNTAHAVWKAVLKW